MATTYLTQPLHRARSLFPQRTATVFGTRRRSYGELADRVSRLAGALRQLGVENGDRVGILAMNSDRYLELYYAIWWCGGVVNPLNIRWSAREIAYALDDCQTRVVIVDDAFVSVVEDLAARSAAFRTVIYAGDGEARGGMYCYEQLILENAPMPDAIRCNEDLAGIFYTGGTTGFPKGVMLSHANLWSCASVAMEAIAPPDLVALHAAPMFHLADGMFLLAQMMRGCPQVIVPSFDAATVASTVAREQVGVTLIVPTMIQMLIDHPDVNTNALSSLRRIVYGASPINEALLLRAMQRLPQVGFVQCYGLTEMSPLISVLGPEDHSAAAVARGRIRSAGQPCHGVEVRIVGDDGRELPRGSVGEIAARGPGMMQGYWSKPEETASTLRDGWLHTGDGAYMDEDGFIFVVDRVKDMIITGGENVYSVEVENAVAQHPSVAACAVIGVPDAQWGEAVHAVIVIRKDRPAPTLDDMRAHCRGLIAGYKCPRSIELREALPLSGSGKVLKTALREPYWKQQQRLVG